MNKDIYNLSQALQAFVGFSENLKGSGHYQYKNAVDVQVIDMATMVEKLEELCLKERKELLEMIVEGNRYTNLLIEELTTLIRVDEIKHG